MSENRIKIRGKVYRAQSLDQISMDDLIMFDTYAAEAGYNLTFDDVQEIALKAQARAIYDEKPEGEEPPKVTLRESAIMGAVTTWLVLRAGGEEVTLKEAARIPGNEIEELAAPADRPTKRGGKSQTQPSPRATLEAVEQVS